LRYSAIGGVYDDIDSFPVVLGSPGASHAHSRHTVEPQITRSATARRSWGDRRIGALPGRSLFHRSLAEHAPRALTKFFLAGGTFLTEGAIFYPDIVRI